MTTAPLPRLQIAQVLADLSDLNIADPTAALHLITTHSPLLSSSHPRRISKPPLSIPLSPAAEREKKRSHLSFTTSATNITPPSTNLSRGRTDMNANTKTSGNAKRGSSSTAQEGNTKQGLVEGVQKGLEDDRDTERAKALLRLFDMREKMKGVEEAGLGNARREVGEVERRFQLRRAEVRV